MNGINVLSVFDGMSCGQIALKELGIKVNKYYASEIDKYAISQTQFNFPETIQLGSVTDVFAEDLDKIDLFIGGSPCQGFSSAGKQLNFDDPRSKLFFEYVRLLKEIQVINPDVKFLLENVNMKRSHLRVISQYMEVFPVRINSNLLSAQNRNRWYWTNIKTKKVGMFNEVWSDIPQPKDENIYLKDILQAENEVDEKYYLTEKALIAFFSGKKGHLKSFNKKAGCLTGGGNSGGNHSDMDIILIKEATTKGFIEVNPGECFDAEHPESKTRRGRKMKHKSNCLMASQNSFLKYTKDFRLRRLTPTECSRLQTIPSWYQWIVSDTQQYKMLGNGWTVEIIKHIFSFMK